MENTEKVVETKESLWSKTKGWVKKNKKKIVIGGLAVVGACALAAGVKSKSDNQTVQSESTSSFDEGRDLEMHFVDPDSKEVLWKERCTEGYMNDYKNDGMQYEEVRKLNGIEEA